jgi:glycosyltransferase involved in cell wall biosynthesis
MKIAYLLGSLNRGGTETLLLDVFKNADKAGFKFIGIHRKGGAYRDDFYAAKSKLYQLSPKFPFDPVYLFKLRRLLKQEETDIVHAQQSLDAVYARIACYGTRIKVVQTLHGFDNLNDKKNKIVALSFKFTHKNIFVSNFQRAYYADKYALSADKQAIVYNGINFDKFKIAQPRAESGKLVLGSVGNFVSVRDQHTICRFLDLLNRQGVEFDFYFVGAESKAEPWRYQECAKYCTDKGLSDKVHFLGSRQDVPELLALWDAFIYSTDHDTFGIAVIEAIAVGIPVFVNDWEVMREISENGKFAALYKTKNERDLLEKFLVFLQNREEYRTKARKAAGKVREKFSIEKHISELSKTYNSLLFEKHKK